METLRGGYDAFDEWRDEDGEDDEFLHETPPAAIGQDERRMQVRAYNHWAGLLENRNLPSVEDLEPDNLPDFGPYSVLLDFGSGVENPGISFLGDALAAECGAASHSYKTLADVPSRSLLSRITDHYMQILANQAPIGFEAEFVNQRGATILYRGILLPYSSDDETIDFVFGVINWKELADQDTADELLLEIGQALDTSPMHEPLMPDWRSLRDDDTSSEEDDEAEPVDRGGATETPLDGQARTPADHPSPVFGLSPYNPAEDSVEEEEGEDDEEDYYHYAPLTLDEGEPEEGRREGDALAGFDTDAPEDEAVPDEEPEAEIADDAEGPVEGEPEDTGFSEPEPESQLEPEPQPDLPVAAESGVELTEALEFGEDNELAGKPHAEEAHALHADSGLTDEPPLEEDGASAEMGLADWLAAAREMAAEARSSEDRTRNALYDAIGRAYDFALAAAQAPADFEELLADAGLTRQERAPMTPVVKLVFGADYDKTRLTEYAAALMHAQRLDLPSGGLAAFLRRADGGLKGVVKEERRLRREESGKPARSRSAPRKAIAKKLRALESQGFEEIAHDGAEFALVMIRRSEEGDVAVLGEVPDEVALVERAARRLIG